MGGVKRIQAFARNCRNQSFRCRQQWRSSRRSRRSNSKRSIDRPLHPTSRRARIRRRVRNLLQQSRLQNRTILHPETLDETKYETFLWERLQSLTDKDGWHGQQHDARVSADPTDPHFWLSFVNEAFFVVGLHPNASRPARRFLCPAIVFNPHDRFEELRRRNLYGLMRERITARDEALAGSRNPMLQPFGAGSEAPQYSGRVVEDAWKCPYHRQ